MNKPTKIITHHVGGTDANPLADTSEHGAEIIDGWHKFRWPGFQSKVFKNEKGEFYHVGYHYVIEKDGKIVQTRGHLEEGAHCIGQNTQSIGVCFSGNFDATLPTKAQLDAFKVLYKRLQKAIPELTPAFIFPHRKFATKTCHGKLLADDYFANLVKGDKELSKQEQISILWQQVYSLTGQLLTRKRMSKNEINKKH